MAKRKIDRAVEKNYAKLGKKFTIIKRGEITRLKALVLIAFALGSVVAVVWGFKNNAYSDSAASNASTVCAKQGEAVPGPGTAPASTGTTPMTCCAGLQPVAQTATNAAAGNLVVGGNYICQPSNTPKACPEYSSPSPDFCSGGTIVPPVKDSSGCYGPPSCKMPTPQPVVCKQVELGGVNNSPASCAQQGGTWISAVQDSDGCYGAPTCKMPEPKACPEYSSPSPDFCSGGTIIPPVKDSNGCYGPPSCKMPTPVPTPAPTPTPIGGGTDQNGCLTSAGYTWCAAKSKCLRTWEEPCGDSSSLTQPGNGSTGGGAAVPKFSCPQIVGGYTQDSCTKQGGIFVPAVKDSNGCYGVSSCNFPSGNNSAGATIHAICPQIVGGYTQDSCTKQGGIFVPVVKNSDGCYGVSSCNFPAGNNPLSQPIGGEVAINCPAVIGGYTLDSCNKAGGTFTPAVKDAGGCYGVSSCKLPATSQGVLYNITNFFKGVFNMF